MYPFVGSVGSTDFKWVAIFIFWMNPGTYGNTSVVVVLVLLDLGSVWMPVGLVG